MSGSNESYDDDDDDEASISSQTIPPLIHYDSDEDLDAIRRRYWNPTAQTVPSSLSATTGTLRVFDTDWSWPEFRENCGLLRSNNSLATCVDAVSIDAGDPYPFGYGLELGQGLLGNVKVRKLVLDPFTFFKCDDDDTISFNPEEAKPLLRYIYASNTLVNVTLNHNYKDTKPIFDDRLLSAVFLTGQILLAMTKIVKPRFQLLEANVMLPVDEFVQFLGCVHASEKLALGPVALEGFTRSVEDTKRVVDAFGSTSSWLLNSLYLEADEQTAAIAEQIIYQLANHLSLEYFYINNQTPRPLQLSAVHRLLTDNTVLKTFGFGNALLDQEGVELLVDGLEANWSVNVLRLSLRKITDSVEQTLASFVTTKANRNGNSIRGLELTSNFHLKMLSSAVLDSAMEGFSYAGTCDKSHFFNEVAATGRRIQLRRLWLENNALRPSETRALVRCVPCMSTIRELRAIKIARMPEHEASSLFLPALRRNGSLHTTTLSYEDGTSIFNEQDAVRVGAYAARNANLPKLLGSTAPDSDSELGVSSLNPALLVAAQAAPRTAPNTTLIGMLGTLSSFAPSTRGDRLRLRDGSPPTATEYL